METAGRRAEKIGSRLTDALVVSLEATGTNTTTQQKGQGNAAEAEGSSGRGGVGPAPTRLLQEDESSSVSRDKKAAAAHRTSEQAMKKGLFQLSVQENKGTAVEYPPTVHRRRYFSLRSQDSRSRKNCSRSNKCSRCSYRNWCQQTTLRKQQFH